MGKGKNAGSQALLLFPLCFQKPYLPWLLTLYSIDTHFNANQQQTAFENIVGKQEISGNEQFLLFPQCFLLNQKIVSPSVNIFDIVSLFAAELEEPKIGL